MREGAFYTRRVSGKMTRRHSVRELILLPSRGDLARRSSDMSNGEGRAELTPRRPHRCAPGAAAMLQDRRHLHAGQLCVSPPTSPVATASRTRGSDLKDFLASHANARSAWRTRSVLILLPCLLLKYILSEAGAC
ncbi:hypothetical protein Cadr_000006602 [Camelus dromedarius]|uniref:Uncharacterized protein n=1 Tax=Camelus dromedarius TaxID=9838 RepID=A0A5N4E6J4_CAMDR|nr:hypothetical protein Cadr_000006602 [Camelus dromedarius]